MVVDSDYERDCEGNDHDDDECELLDVCINHPIIR